MEKGIVHTRVVSTILIVACIIISAGLSGYFLDLYKTGSASANQPPTAVAGEGPVYGYPTVPVEFDGTKSTDPDGEIFSYEWDFGDGYSGIGLRPSHAYDVPGTYNVALTVTDNDGATDIDVIDVIISQDTDGTGMYTLLTVNEILTNGTAWYGKMVRIVYATVTDAGSFDSGYGSDPNGWVKFYVSDESTTRELEVYCKGGATRPLELKRGDQVNVSAMLDKYKNNWEMNVRKDALDRVTLCPAIYHLYTLGELLGDRLGHNGELIIVKNLEILSTWTYGWYVTDDTTNESVSLYAEIGANVSQYVNVSDIVTIQGIFTYYDYDLNGPDDNEWELKVRNAALDMIQRTWEFDYPPTISSVTRTPAEPSPYDSVTINASVNDNRMVETVSLLYSFDGGAETRLDMSRTAGVFYETVIPAAAHGTNVSYHVLARDNGGQETQSAWQHYVSMDRPPVIDDMGQNPEWVRPPDIVTVWALLLDDGGISSASIVFSTDGWANTSYAVMLDDGTAPDDIAGDGAFNGTLGSFPDGTVVEYYISVRDTMGNNVTSKNISFTSSYDQPPIFNGVYRDIEIPSSKDSVRVITNVTDDYMLLSVVLVYNNGSGFVEVNMTKRADGNFQAYIPPQPSLAVVEYYVNATDNATHVVSSPSKPFKYIVDYGVPTVLYATGHGETVGIYDEFSRVVTDMGFRWQEANINDVNLDWVEFIVINDPKTTYTAAELAAIQTFISNGGGLLLMSQTDFNDYGYPENANPILENLSIPGRFNDDSYQDEWYCFDYPTYGNPPYSKIMEYIPYFNYYHYYDNTSIGYPQGQYDDWGCFALDSTGITSNFVAEKTWLKGWSMSTLVGVGSDTVVIQATDHGYNKDSTSGTTYTPYLVGSRPPILAAHTGIGTGKVLYGGIGAMLSYKNWAGWDTQTGTGNANLSRNIINYLVNVPLPKVPSVSDVKHSPLEPASAQTVTVEANVSGVGPAISSVTLHFSVNGSYYVETDMVNVGGNTYSAIIPRMPAGTVVTYYVQVADDSNHFGYWPIEPGRSGIGWYVVQGGIIDHIVLSEISYNPPGTDTGFEFVELYNPLPAALDIGGWQLCEISGKDNYTDWSPRIPAGSFIPAFGYFLLAQSEYDGWGADFIVGSWSLGNNGDGFGRSIFMYDDRGNVIDRCGYDDHVIGYLNSSLYEGWPFTGNPKWDTTVAPVLSDADGSMERLPGFNDPFRGNWQDTGNNSADFVFRKFVEAQGSSSPREYPPWTVNITSPYLLPDDHPVNMISSQPVGDSKAASEPIKQDFSAGESPVDANPVSAGTVWTPSLVLVVPLVLMLVPRRREY